MLYRYAQLDSRPTPEARAHNEAIFASGPVWGLEVTNKEWAGRCEAVIGNQHGEGKAPNLADYGLLDDSVFTDSSKAACEVALMIPLPPASVTLLFDRVDLDAVCAAAVLERRAQIADGDSSVFTRIQAVAKADNFAVGKTPWQPYPILTEASPWPPSGAVTETRSLAAINAAVCDVSVPLARRVEWAETWLLYGQSPERVIPAEDDANCRYCGSDEYQETARGYVHHCTYQALVDHQRKEMIASTKLTHRAGVATVETTYPGSVSGVGFAVAPIVVAVNTACTIGSTEPYRKITIASWGVLSPEQMAASRDRLNALEPIWALSGETSNARTGLTRDEAEQIKAQAAPAPEPLRITQAGGWGGNIESGILGSPQGRSTTLSVEAILDAIKGGVK